MESVEAFRSSAPWAVSRVTSRVLSERPYPSMSTHQQVKPRCANQSITEESGRPRTVRSKVGSEAIDDPCTNSTAGLASGEPAYFSHRNSRTSPASVVLRVQCSRPVTAEVLMEVWVGKVREGRTSLELGAGVLDHA